MEKNREGDEAAAALVFVVIMLGLLAYWWWQLGDTGRLAWLLAIGDTGGHGPAPSGLAAQLEWLLEVRTKDMQGMMMLFVLAALAGFTEGSARRQAAQRSRCSASRPRSAGSEAVQSSSAACSNAGSHSLQLMSSPVRARFAQPGTPRSRRSRLPHPAPDYRPARPAVAAAGDVPGRSAT